MAGPPNLAVPPRVRRLLRLRELEALRDLARNANARIYVGFAKHAPAGDGQGE